MFRKDLLDRAKMSLEDWTKPLIELDKESTYLIGSFNHGNVATVVSYKDGKFYFSNKASIQVADYYNFKSLSRAYEYFEQMFYGRGEIWWIKNNLSFI